MDDARIYDSLEKVNATLAAQGILRARMEQAQSDTRERLFGANGQPGIVSFLQGEISETQKTVAEHGRKFVFYRGAVAVLTFVWGAAVAVVAAVINHHK